MEKSVLDQTIDPEWINVFRGEAVRQETLEEALSSIPIFSLLTLRELRLVARIVHIRHYQAGEVVIRRGVEQSGLYLLRQGSVHIVRQDLEGHREIVGTLRAPELLGEFALLDGTPRSSSVVAAEKSELIGFFKPDLMEILVTKPALGCKIVLRLAEEMARSLRKDYTHLRETGFVPEPVELPLEGNGQSS